MRIILLGDKQQAAQWIPVGKRLARHLLEGDGGTRTLDPTEGVRIRAQRAGSTARVWIEAGAGEYFSLGVKSTDMRIQGARGTRAPFFAAIAQMDPENNTNDFDEIQRIGGGRGICAVRLDSNNQARFFRLRNAGALSKEALFTFHTSNVRVGLLTRPQALYTGKVPSGEVTKDRFAIFSPAVLAQENPGTPYDGTAVDGSFLYLSADDGASWAVAEFYINAATELFQSDMKGASSGPTQGGTADFIVGPPAFVGNNTLLVTITYRHPHFVTFAPHKNGVYFMLRSTDGGFSWSEVVNGDIVALIVDPDISNPPPPNEWLLPKYLNEWHFTALGDGRVLALGVSGGNLLSSTSTDYGNSWADPVTVTALAAAPSVSLPAVCVGPTPNPETEEPDPYCAVVLARPPDGAWRAYKTVDAGATWTLQSALPITGAPAKMTCGRGGGIGLAQLLAAFDTAQGIRLLVSETGGNTWFEGGVVSEGGSGYDRVVRLGRPGDPADPALPDLHNNGLVV